MAAPFVRSFARAAVALALVAAAACASGPKKPPVGTLEPDKFLFERGTEALNQKRWYRPRVLPAARRQLSAEPVPRRRQARDRRHLPRRRDAEAYVLAINEFREFLSFYPTHTRADYAQYKLGHGALLPDARAERDQTETQRGDRRADTLRGAVPEQRAADRGEDAAARGARPPQRVRSIASATSTAASKWYPGAIDRFRDVLKNDPQYSRPRRRLLLPGRGASSK